MNEVWSYSENEEAAMEVATAAGEVAKATSSVPVIIEMGDDRQRVHPAGGKLVLKTPSGLESTPGVKAEAMARAARQRKPIAIFVGATRNGREVASRLAAKLGIGCISEAFRLKVDGDRLVADRTVFAGKVVASVACGFPLVGTVKLGSFARFQATEGSVEELDVGEIKDPVKVVSKSKKEVGAVDLKRAKVIVSAGRGVKRKEDLAIIEALANDLGGALGCSRPISSDLGWLPEEHHIGLTGITVKPDLYLAVGISGQLQHIAGMKDSKLVAAINTDKDAPMFQASDYGVVGDLYEVVPAIRKVLAARK